MEPEPHPEWTLNSCKKDNPNMDLELDLDPELITLQINMIFSKNMVIETLDGSR